MDFRIKRPIEKVRGIPWVKGHNPIQDIPIWASIAFLISDKCSSIDPDLYGGFPLLQVMGQTDGAQICGNNPPIVRRVALHEKFRPLF